jgi:pimeloyl-ACP methyl ester carboxylesterase
VRSTTGRNRIRGPRAQSDRHGLIWLPEDAFARLFAQHASTLAHVLLAAAQRPLAAACLGVPGAASGLEGPAEFLVADEDRMIRPENQRFMAERMSARVRTAPADHMPMVTAPSAVVDIVLEAVREIESSG